MNQLNTFGFVERWERHSQTAHCVSPWRCVNNQLFYHLTLSELQSLTWTIRSNKYESFRIMSTRSYCTSVFNSSLCKLPKKKPRQKNREREREKASYYPLCLSEYRWGGQQKKTEEKQESKQILTSGDRCVIKSHSFSISILRNQNARHETVCYLTWNRIHSTDSGCAKKGWICGGDKSTLGGK